MSMPTKRGHNLNWQLIHTQKLSTSVTRQENGKLKAKKGTTARSNLCPSFLSFFPISACTLRNLLSLTDKSHAKKLPAD